MTWDGAEYERLAGVAVPAVAGWVAESETGEPRPVLLGADLGAGRLRVPVPAETNILCFRYGRDPALQVAVRERLLEQGRFQLSSTEVHGERWLRLTVMAPATDERTVEELLDAIEEVAAG